MPRAYLCIDQKSFFASVEAVERGLDPMTARLVVADAERSSNTICLAVSVAMKKLGVRNRCRLGEVPRELGAIIAVPRMRVYIAYAVKIYKVFLKYIAPEDIYVYSIDESFLDVTNYLKMYGMDSHTLAAKIIADVRETVGTLSTCGIGTNLYLAKIALDIRAKHAPDFIAELTEETFREQLWDHRPLTDFWRIGTGTQKRLFDHGITTMRGITQTREEDLYRWFGIDAELMIDHAWGREPCLLSDIQAYHSQSKSLSSTQVLMRDYRAEEALVVAKEMADALCLNMASQHIRAESVALYVGYSYTQGVGGTGGTAQFASATNLASCVLPAIEVLFRRVVDASLPIRRLGITCSDLSEDDGACQLNLYEDLQAQLREHALQETMLAIKARFGRNAILKGMNYAPGATGRERNMQIGGHKSGGEIHSGTHVPQAKSQTVCHV